MPNAKSLLTPQSFSDDGVLSTSYLDDNIVKGNVYTITLVPQINTTTVYFTSEVSAGQELDFIFLLPLNFSVETGTLVVNIYEDTDYTGGSLLNIVNRNRTSPNTSKLDVKQGATGATKGTLLYSKLYGTSAFGGAVGGGSGVTSNSIILNTSKRYLYELTTSENSLVGIEAEFVEL